jgi:uncharacterized membrane protein
MLCPNCGQNTSIYYRHCSKCGFALNTLPASGSGQIDKQIPDLSVIQSEVHEIRASLDSLNNRLNSLEGMLSRESARKPAAESPPPTVIQQTPEVQQEAFTPLQTVIEETVLKEIEAVLPPVKQAPAASQVPPPEISAPARKPPKNGEWEQILGGNWLARIGILALIIGAAFFLKFAFDKQWLGPTARVILGVGVGFVLLGLGYYWNKRYPIFAQALSGGGIALLYLCIFAAFAAFNLLGFYLAIFFLVIISAISTFLAVRYNSMAMAILGIVGAFAAPFILGASYHFSSIDGKQLLIYIVLVDIGVLALSTFRNWRWFNLLALAATSGSYWIWYHRFGDNASLLTAELSLTVLFLIFFGVTVLYSFIWKRPEKLFDYILMSLNAAAYFIVSQYLMWDELRAWMGGFSLLVALLYGGLAYYALRKSTEDQRMRYFSLGIALVFLTAAVPVHFGNSGWATIAWAGEGLAAVWLSAKFKSRYFSYSGYLIFLLMVVRLLGFDTPVSSREFVPVFNMRVLAFLFGIAATYLAGYLIWQKKLPRHELFFIFSNGLAIWIAAVETIELISKHPANNLGTFTLVFLFLMAVWLALQTILTQHTASLFDRYLWILNFVFFLVISILLWPEYRAWMGLIYLILAVIYGLQTYLFWKNRTIDLERWTGLVGVGLSLTFLTLAMPGQFGNHAWATIAWAIEGLFVVWFSLKFQIRNFHYAGYLIFLLMAVRLLGFDTPVSSREFVPVINMRVLAFLFGIAATYLAGHLLWRKKLPRHELFFVFSNALALWIVAVETMPFINRHPVNNSGALTLAFFLVMAAWVAFQNILTRRTGALFDSYLQILNFVFFLGISIPLWHEFRSWMGLIYLILAVIYGIRTYLLFKNQTINFKDWPGLFGVGISLTFLTLAAAGQFGNHAWATVAWAVEMVLVTWLSFFLRESHMRIYSYVLFAFTAGRLLVFDTFNVLNKGMQNGMYTPVWNERVLAFGLSIAAIYLTVYLFWRYRDQDPEWKMPTSTLLIAASLFTLWIVSFESWNYFDLQIAVQEAGARNLETVRDLHSAQKVSLTAVWAVYAVIVLIVGISRRLRIARLCALSLLAVAVIKVFVYDVFVLEQVYRIVAFTGLGILLIISGYLYHRYSRKIKEFLVSKNDDE